MGSVHRQHCNYRHREEATSTTSEEQGKDHAAGPCPAVVLHNFKRVTMRSESTTNKYTESTANLRNK
jgi:hypothetical protein